MHDTALFSLRLRPPRHLALPPWLGRSAQAWYLDSMHQIHPTLSAAVHDSSGIKPYTVSTLLVTDGSVLRDFDPQRGALPPQMLLQISTLHRDVTTLTHSLSEQWLQDGICLHDQFFRVESIDVQMETYSGLLEKSARQPRSRRLSFDFLSPTVFKKTGGMQMPLPLPAHVFGSLLQRWKQFSMIELAADLDRYIEESVSIRAHRIQTQVVSFERANRGTYTGFRGTVEFHADSTEQPHFGQLLLLADFAAWSRVGSHTTVGLGRVRYS